MTTRPLGWQYRSQTTIPHVKIQEILIALFAFIPGEILFGNLVDTSCTLWSASGSCASYDTTTFRYGLFGGAALVR